MCRQIDVKEVEDKVQASIGVKVEVSDDAHDAFPDRLCALDKFRMRFGGERSRG